ncbi:hypothetical protein [Streptomyces lincolnensis]|uniref:hypothetical protein n=1 Tax=Streptomyces lincolnensis TaxID=1915 RepID=UPI001E3697D1|nr:hypothetical protein [Streptomyces lincolnensis]
MPSRREGARIFYRVAGPQARALLEGAARAADAAQAASAGGAEAGARAVGVRRRAVVGH